MDIKDIAREVKATLKKEFPACTFSVKIERYSLGQSMTVALMTAPFAVFDKDEDVNGNKRLEDYAQLNQYQFRSEGWEPVNNGVYLTPKAWDMLKRVDEIQNGRNWDNSDLQTDYFDVNYYTNLNIGRWDKPFVQR